jgi:NAD(P)-dependent dehydrogenase (short-subunit alcohol dehydrogenase family)
MSRLQGKTAIVTGAASGIGRGIAECFAKEGARVVLADINIKGAVDVIEMNEALISSGALPLWMDVTSDQNVKSAIQEALIQFDHIDILVNAAGISGEIQDDFFEHTLGEIMKNAHSVFEVNFFGAMRTTRVLGEHFRKRRSGSIINIASIVAHGRGGMQLKPPYNASKAGLIEFTHWSAIQLAPYNVRVNSISPGLIYTELWEKLGAQLRNKYPDKYGHMMAREIFDLWVKERVPLAREQTPEDVGKAAVYLASDEAINVSGTDIAVDGGVLAR